MSDASDVSFAGSVPEIYDRYLVPMIFDTYAADLAARVKDSGATSVLELAAGTGAVTRRMAATLPDDVELVSTDLSPAMIERARHVGTARVVDWRVADAMALPFEDGSFDAVVCQFGVMFFPDRVGAYRGVQRVLRDEGTFLFNVWGPVEFNEFAHVLVESISALYPDDPPTFLRRIPHGYHDEREIRADLESAGFDGAVTVDHVDAVSSAASAHDIAVAYCHGTPMFNYLDAHGPGHVARATDVATAALADAFGAHQPSARINALVITARA